MPYDIWDLTQMVRNLLVVLETQVQALGRNDPLEKEMATHSCILAWRILWTEKPGGLQSMGLQRVMDTTERLTHCGLNQSPLYWRRSVLTAKPPGKSLCHFLHSPSRQPQCWIHGEAFLPPSWAWISSTLLPLHRSFPPVFTAYSCFPRVLSLPCEVVWPHYSIGSVHLRSTFVTPQH